MSVQGSIVHGSCAMEVCGSKLGFYYYYFFCHYCCCVNLVKFLIISIDCVVKKLLLTIRVF